MNTNYDFCALCGKRVEQDRWRQHMIWHQMVLEESPLKNGEGLDVGLVRPGGITGNFYGAIS